MKNLLLALAVLTSTSIASAASCSLLYKYSDINGRLLTTSKKEIGTLVDNKLEFQDSNVIVEVVQVANLISGKLVLISDQPSAIDERTVSLGELLVLSVSESISGNTVEHRLVCR